MEKKRTVCIIHKKEEIYEAYYFKEFFKWIGFSHFLFSYDGEKDNDIIERLEGNKFDLFLCLNYKREEWTPKLEKKIDSSVVHYIFTHEQENGTALKRLFSQLGKDFFLETNRTTLSQLFQNMIDIYDKYNMVSLLYPYSFILLKGIPDEKVEKMKESYLNILNEMESLDTEELKHTEGREYYLYAKFYAQAKCGILYQHLKIALPFDVGECLDRVNTIYKYDSNFYRAEYLKTKFTILDDRFRMYSVDYLRVCIDKCEIDICKSYYYYSLGKELEIQHKNFLALEAYLMSNKLYQYNIKAIFKIALERYHAKDQNNAIEYLKQILVILNRENIGCWDNMSLMDIEYIFKCAMILAKNFQSPLREEYYEIALKASNYVENGSDKDFIQKMYREPGLVQDVKNAMVKRLKRRRLEFFKNN